MYFYKNEFLYIAGPECFYTGGDEILLAMRRKAEAYGFSVSLPNDNPLKLDHEDLRLNADTIFRNCAESMNRSTGIIVDLETFRGTEPDGGSMYEVGMAYARGLRCYAYTRDKRDMVCKYPGARQDYDGKVYDLDGRMLPYHDLPFSPCVIGSCKIIEGDFDACLKVMMQDIDEERKLAGSRHAPASSPSPCAAAVPGAKPRAYLAGPQRYDKDAASTYEAMKKICAVYGFEPVTPLDSAAGVPDSESSDPYARAYHLFDNWQQQVRDCSVIIGDLNDFHGWEPQSDVSFELGMAWQLRKKCFGYMADTTIMRERIPHDGNGRDFCGSNVENFGYPINLMFASSMPILQGDFEQVMAQVAERCKQEGVL